MDTDNQVENESQEVTTTQSAEEKTFTQADVNRIVAERVSDFSDYNELKEKAAKYDAAEEANKSELEKAQDLVKDLRAKLDAKEKAEALSKMREEVSKKTGVPANLLTAETEEACEAQAESIKAFAKPEYPKVKDGGEPQGNVKRATRDQFAEWLNKQ